MTARTWLTDMSQEECWSLVAHAAVGRLGVIVDGRPQVFPVCHSYSDGFITFPTNEGTKMHAALQWPWVCFEVDMVDPAGNTGWSVMVDGRAEEVTDRAAIERASSVRAAPWRTQPTLRWVRIVPTQVSGRRIDTDAPVDEPGAHEAR